jgi:hypothetical protein
MVDVVRHTPGPWQQQTLLVLDANHSQIAHCTRWEGGRPIPEIAEANARFIAAAPDLFDALKQLRIDANRLCDRQLGGSYEADCRLSIKQADDAIAKAMGL